MPHDTARFGGRRRRAAWLAAGFAAALATAVSADAGTPTAKLEPRAALERSQAAVGGQLGGWRFVDTSGAAVPLSDYLGKPLIVSLIYTGCNDICPTVSQSLHDAVAAAQDSLGADSFNVVTLGFDARADTPVRMRSFARARGLDDLPNWVFLSGAAADIDGLSRDLGFSFARAPHGFDHLQQTSVIDPEGRVYRHIYGAVFDPPAVVQALRELTLGRRASLTSIDGLIDRVRLVCTVYNPNTGRYELDYSVVVAATGGGISLLVIAVILVRAWRGVRRPRPAIRRQS